MLSRDAYPKLPDLPRPRAVASLTCFTTPNLAAVRVINAACRDPRSPEELATLLDAQYVTMVALRGGIVVAFMSYHIGPTGIDLRHFAVAPEHRCIGVGSQMFRALAAKLAAHGRPRLTAAISEDDPATYNWFVRRGMRGCAVSRDGIRPGIDAFVFEYLNPTPGAIGVQNCPRGRNDIP